jgi:hypothetical protein
MTSSPFPSPSVSNHCRKWAFPRVLGIDDAATPVCKTLQQLSPVQQQTVTIAVLKQRPRRGLYTPVFSCRQSPNEDQTPLVQQDL